MPLNEGAKPGSKEFSENVATEVKAGKPAKQAVAIAYSEARKDMSGGEFKKLTDLLDEFFKEEAQEPEHKNDDAEDGDASLIDASLIDASGKTDGALLMDAINSLRGRVEIASSKKV